MKTIRGILTLVAVCALCGAVAQDKMTREEYIDKYKAIALELQEIYGIPASIKLAQGILESDCGNSPLALRSNNHFGLKCKKSWTGPTVSHDDDLPGECFRKYECVEDSYRDQSAYVDSQPRYQSLFELDPQDYKGWAYGLKQAGYATNPKYPEQLIKIIEDNRLYLLDRGEELTAAVVRPLPEPVAPQMEVLPAGRVDIDNYIVAAQSFHGYAMYSNNGSRFVVAREGDTFGNVSKEFGISERRLLKINDLPAGAKLSPGEMVYLKPKARRASNGKVLHTVREGDTMHSISQQYGIRLSRLAAINKRQSNASLREGQQIRLM